MEIVKRIKAIPRDIDILLSTSQIIDLRYAERNGREVISNFEYENEKFNFRLTFRIPEELKEDLKKARGFKKIWELYKKHNRETIKEYVKREIEKHKKEIERLKNLERS